MDDRLKQDAQIEDALHSYPLAEMPQSITLNVMKRIQKDTTPIFFTWRDFVLSLVLVFSFGAVFFSLQNLPPIMVAKLHIQGVLLYQSLVINAHWLVPAVFFGLASFLAALTIPPLMQMLRRW
jgi:hypothetical protein